MGRTSLSKNFIAERAASSSAANDTPAVWQVRRKRKVGKRDRVMSIVKGLKSTLLDTKIGKIPVYLMSREKCVLL